ncbi:putative CCR4-associated factor 1-like protein 11 [Dichanthelium oligosanthes]|uniref:poly(A)-specific ribonuclease n=1 Tax=Dichanthelium oligosanthes TaxID=888268 RepID=A0A1E5VNU3_9POAL|nr:putative CCR4-associated factor 1-like protein 11 [Dichanthelium oligosanthes]
MFRFLPPPFAAVGPFMGPPQLPPPYAAFPYFGGVAARHPAPYVQPVQLQSVTAVNFEAEMDLIAALLPQYPYVVVDTEYPGTVHCPPDGTRDADLTPDERYALVKANVDELPIVQLGLTLCDAHGSLPVVVDYTTGYYTERAWEFNFSDFDIDRHRHVPRSVEFLRTQGIDFDRALHCGVSSAAFKDKLAGILSAPQGNELTWVAFGGAYDLAYLVKMLGDAGQPLPETREEFMARVRELLGGRVFDAKYMAENCGHGDLRGVGLRTVASNLGVARWIVDMPCLAGPKSLTACRIHAVMRMHVLSQEDAASYEGLIHGLQ